MKDMIIESGVIGRHPSSKMPIALCLDRYLSRAKSGDGRDSGPVADVDGIEIRNRQIIEYWQNSPVSALTPHAQEAFFKHLLGTGKADTTASRVMRNLRAALLEATKWQELSKAPHIFHCSHKSPKVERLPEIDEYAALFEAADRPWLCTFMLFDFFSGGRKSAVLDLTREQCDLRAMRIDLLVPGTVQKRTKRRAILPIVSPLIPHIEAAPGYIVNDNGRQLDDIKSAWRRARTKAGLGGHVQAKHIRHTVRTWMARQNVPQAQKDAWLGHVNTDNEGWRYEVMEPSYLADAAAAVEALICETARMAVRAVSMSKTVGA